MKYRIVSTHTVCGHVPGTVVDGDDLVGGDVAHLLASGHIVPVKQSKMAEATAEVEPLNEEMSE
jgi:hypothetical protein